jgi:hypothetical protein
MQNLNPTETSFIDVYEYSLFSDLNLPDKPTSITIWYKNDNSNIWGLVMRRTVSNSKYDKNTVWKMSWSNKKGKLVPTNNSTVQCPELSDSLYKSLVYILKNEIDEKNSN